ncbi:hypothetical protein D3C72_2275240 [compost metagenome]
MSMLPPRKTRGRLSSIGKGWGETTAVGPLAGCARAGVALKAATVIIRAASVRVIDLPRFREGAGHSIPSGED